MHPKQYLDRREAAQFLTDQGFRTSHKTLAKLASVGGGPEMHKFGTRRVLYEPAALLAWANARLSPTRRSTSQAA